MPGCRKAIQSDLETNKRKIIWEALGQGPDAFMLLKVPQDDLVVSLEVKVRRGDQLVQVGTVCNIREGRDIQAVR